MYISPISSETNFNNSGQGCFEGEILLGEIACLTVTAFLFRTSTKLPA